MTDYEKDVRIVIEKRANCNQWGWSCKVDGLEWYGYEHDYLNAEDMVQDTLRDMGVDA